MMPHVRTMQDPRDQEEIAWDCAVACAEASVCDVAQSRFWNMTFLDRIFSICAVVIQQER